MIGLILGTATPGGGFPLYGAAYAESLNAQEPRLRIETRNTKGSTENLPLLEAGKLDLGLVAGELASAALARPGTGLRIVAAMYSSPGIVHRSRRQPGAPHRRPQGQAGGARHAGLGHHGAGPHRAASRWTFR